MKGLTIPLQIFSNIIIFEEVRLEMLNYVFTPDTNVSKPQGPSCTVTPGHHGADEHPHEHLRQAAACRRLISAGELSTARSIGNIDPNILIG